MHPIHMYCKLTPMWIKFYSCEKWVLQQTGLEREGGVGPRLGWKRREEAGPKPLLGVKSKRVKENQF
jgi:hypothetical protein